MPYTPAESWLIIMFLGAIAASLAYAIAVIIMKGHEDE
jgi:hypothetical protein